MQLATIKISKLHAPRYLLRPVRKTSVEYQEMLDSIKDNGLWQPILVRPLDGGEYEVVDGHWRYCCCCQLRWKEIPCIIRELTDDQLLLAQLQANGIRPETTPLEFSERLAQILRQHPDMTVARLSRYIRKSPDWISNILALQKLNNDYKKSLLRGEISLQAACALARLPPSLQDEFYPKAFELRAADFVKLARQELKRLREACHTGYIDSFQNVEPVPFFRKLKEIKDEYREQVMAGPVLLAMDAQSSLDGWNACLAWLLHLDPASRKLQERMIKRRKETEQLAIEKRREDRKKLRELREQSGDNLETLDLDF